MSCARAIWVSFIDFAQLHHAQNSPFIIMGDEPTGNQDSHNSRNGFDIIEELAHEQQQNIIVVTHNEDFSQRTDLVIEMVDGEIVGSQLMEHG